MGNNPNAAVQLDVFDEQRECDEAQSLQGPDGINLNSHLDVFYTILGQVNIYNRIKQVYFAFECFTNFNAMFRSIEGR